MVFIYSGVTSQQQYTVGLEQTTVCFVLLWGTASSACVVSTKYEVGKEDVRGQQGKSISSFSLLGNFMHVPGAIPFQVKSISNLMVFSAFCAQLNPPPTQQAEQSRFNFELDVCQPQPFCLHALGD